MNNKKTKKKIAWLRYSWGDRIFLAVVYTSLILITLVCLYPLYFTVIASFSDAFDVYSGKVNLLPSGFSIDSYKLVFQNKSIWVDYGNTLLYTVVGTVFNLILTIPAAYALSRKCMYGRNFLMTVFLITMYFGGGMIPTYMLFDSMNLLNTRGILILCGGVSVYNVIVTRTFFQNNIPDSLMEAAKIDGASDFLMQWRIGTVILMP